MSSSVASILQPGLQEQAVPVARVPFVRWHRDLGSDDIGLVGGKNASLGELMRLDGIRVPNGFAITTDAFREFVEPVRETISEHIAGLHAGGDDSYA